MTDPDDEVANLLRRELDSLRIPFDDATAQHMADTASAIARVSTRPGFVAPLAAAAVVAAIGGATFLSADLGHHHGGAVPAGGSGSGSGSAAPSATSSVKEPNSPVCFVLPKDAKQIDGASITITDEGGRLIIATPDQTRSVTPMPCTTAAHANAGNVCVYTLANKGATVAVVVNSCRVSGSSAPAPHSS
jgi:hypothetical protein